MTQTKRCIKGIACEKQEQPATTEFFSRDRQNPDGLRNCCKQCEAAMRAARAERKAKPAEDESDLAELKERLVQKLGHRVCYGEHPIVTLAMVAEAHELDPETVGRAFRRNAGEFKLGQDYFELSAAECAALEQPDILSARATLGGRERIALTISGYLLLGVRLRGPNAAAIRRALVDYYLQPGAPANVSDAPVTVSERPALEDLRPFLQGMNERLDRLEAEQAKHHQIVGARLEDIDAKTGERRRKVLDRDRGIILETTRERFQGRCACCGEKRVLTPSGEPVDGECCFHGYHSQGKKKLGQVWIVCSGCNVALRDPRFHEVALPLFCAFALASAQARARRTTPDFIDSLINARNVPPTARG
jgi:hypothetical protein